jgi:hypothetical protein
MGDRVIGNFIGDPVIGDHPILTSPITRSCDHPMAGV